MKKKKKKRKEKKRKEKEKRKEKKKKKKGLTQCKSPACNAPKNSSHVSLAPIVLQHTDV